MSIALRVDLSQFGEITSAIKQLSQLDVPAMLDDIGALVAEQAKTRIREEKRSPDGEPWAPLNPDYEQRKREKSSGGILVFENYLHESIQHTFFGNSVTVGSNRIYAAHHQFGGEEIGSGIPARPYLGFSPENIEDIHDLVINFLRDQLELLA